jgi:hypothetical protein
MNDEMAPNVGGTINTLYQARIGRGGYRRNAVPGLQMATPDTIAMNCDLCGDDREFRRELREKTLAVHGEPITVTAPTLVCPSCGVTQPDPEGECY